MRRAALPPLPRAPSASGSELEGEYTPGGRTHTLLHSQTHTHTHIPPKLLYRAHLLLAQDDHPSRFNWMPGGQVVPGAKALAILVSLPEAISGCPGDADVVPAAVAH